MTNKWVFLKLKDQVYKDNVTILTVASFSSGFTVHIENERLEMMADIELTNDQVKELIKTLEEGMKNNSLS